MAAPIALSLLALCMFAGCASTQPDVSTAVQHIADFTKADLTQAITMANQAQDAGAPYRARCYTTLMKHVPDGSTVGQAIPQLKDVVSAFESAAELDAKARSGGGVAIPADIHADCAVIVTSVEQFAVRFGAKIAGPAMGVPAVGNLLP